MTSAIERRREAKRTAFEKALRKEMKRKATVAGYGQNRRAELTALEDRLADYMRYLLDPTLDGL